MSPLLFFSGLSILLQLAAGILALWLIRFTGRWLSWGLIALGIFLITFRRLYALSYVSLQSPFEIALLLLISLCFLLGLYWITPFFSRIKEGTRSLKVLAETNRIVIRASGEEELLRDACRTIVEVGGYPLAWIGYAERDENKSVRPVAQAGAEEEYLASIRVTWAEGDAHGKGPTGTSIRTGKPVVSSISSDPHFLPWAKEATKRGFASSIALPLVSDGETFGAVSVYAVERDAFGAEQVKLLSEMVDNVAFGIVALRERNRRRQIEEALRSSEEKFYKAFRHSPIIQSIVRLSDEKYVEVNDCFSKMLGFAREEVVGHSGNELGIFEPEARAEILRRLREEGCIRDMEFSFFAKGGEKREGLYSAEIVEIGGEPHYVGMTRDVTEIKRSERERQKLQEEQIETLKQTDRLKDEFLSVVSHELSTPLNAITGFGSILEDEIEGPLNEKQHRSVARLLRASERMLVLVNDLLDYARVQAGTFVVHPSETDYPSLIEEAIACFETMASEKALFIESEVSVSSPVCLDRQRIFQVLANLLANAVKFSPEGGRICVRAYREGRALVTEVSDQGLGIAPEDREKIFQPFKQLDMGLTRKAGGVGLGLSISRAIVEAHGGTLVAESPGLGKGATFRFTIP